MDRRQEILIVASRLFREKGYHATTIRDIAKAMSMQPSSLYSHVKSKEEILWEISNKAADSFNNQAKRVEPSLAVKEKLEQLISGHFDVMMQELPNATVFFQDWKFLPSDLRAEMVAKRDAYEAHFLDCVSQGKSEDVFVIQDVRVSTLFVLSALNWSYHWLKPDGPLGLDALKAHYTQLIFDALNAT